MKGATVESRDIRQIYQDQVAEVSQQPNSTKAADTAPVSAPDVEAALPADLHPGGADNVSPSTAEVGAVEPLAAPAPAPAVAPTDRDALLSEIGELRVKARSADAMTELLAANPDLRDQFIQRVNGTPAQTGIPENYEELSPTEQAKALTGYFVQQAREQLIPTFRAELDAIKGEMLQSRQQEELFTARPESAREIQKPEVLEACETYLTRFSELPVEKQPTLLEAYDFVQSQNWRAQALRAEAANQSVQRKAAVQIQKPGANPGVELGVDVRKAASDRDAFRMAAAEAIRVTQQT